MKFNLCISFVVPDVYIQIERFNQPRVIRVSRQQSNRKTHANTIIHAVVPDWKVDFKYSIII
jgi:hypothetical protein